MIEGSIHINCPNRKLGVWRTKPINFTLNEPKGRYVRDLGKVRHGEDEVDIGGIV